MFGDGQMHDRMEWDPNGPDEFDPRTMLTPPEYAKWCPKYFKSVVVNIRRRGTPHFGNWGFPFEVPCPFPEGK